MTLINILLLIGFVIIFFIFSKHLFKNLKNIIDTVFPNEYKYYKGREKTALYTFSSFEMNIGSILNNKVVPNPFYKRRCYFNGFYVKVYVYQNILIIRFFNSALLIRNFSDIKLSKTRFKKFLTVNTHTDCGNINLVIKNKDYEYMKKYLGENDG